MVLGGMEAVLGGILGGAEGAKVAAGTLIAVVVVLLAVVGVFVYLYVSQKSQMDNNCACIIDNTERWPKGKGKDSPAWAKGLLGNGT